MKLLFVTLEMGTDGTFFRDGAGAKCHRDKEQHVILVIITI